MAKGKGRHRGGNDFTYEGDQATRRQAQHLAGALAPSRGSIARPYRESIQDVGGYTKALADLLGGIQGNVSGAYDKARATQEQINAAAQGRLGTLGDYSAGTQAAAGGIGDSSLSSLVATGAAAESNAARQPGIAASRGAGQQASLQQAMSDALAARREGIRQSAVSLFAQLKDQGLNRDLQYQGFNEGRRQFNQSQAQQQSQFNASLGEQQRQFNAEQQRLWAGMVGAGGGGGGAGGGGGLGGGRRSPFGRGPQGTASQIKGWQADIADSINDSINGRPNPDYGKKTTKGAPGASLMADGKTYVDKRHWIVVPLGAGHDPGRQVTPLKLYTDLVNHGFNRLQVVRTMQQMYDSSLFAQFLRHSFPGVYRQLYGTGRPKTGNRKGGHSRDIGA